jgi:hypothetical protein
MVFPSGVIAIAMAPFATLIRLPAVLVIVEIGVMKRPALRAT